MLNFNYAKSIQTYVKSPQALFLRIKSYLMRQCSNVRGRNIAGHNQTIQIYFSTTHSVSVRVCVLKLAPILIILRWSVANAAA